MRKNSSSLSFDDGNLLTLFISLPGRVDEEGAAVSAPAGRCRGKRNAKFGRRQLGVARGRAPEGRRGCAGGGLGLGSSA